MTVPIACQSEGALEVYVEPVLPQPQLDRDRPVAGRGHARRGWRARSAGGPVVVDDGGVGRTTTRRSGTVLTTLDLDAAGVDERSFVVVATQGHYDEDALERALATPAAYVGLVASRKRADAVLGYLRDRGVADEALARVHAPAGLDLGQRSRTEEIAVAILAELVSSGPPDGSTRGRPRRRDPARTRRSTPCAA